MKGKNTIKALLFSLSIFSLILPTEAFVEETHEDEMDETVINQNVLEENIQNSDGEMIEDNETGSTGSTNSIDTFTNIDIFVEDTKYTIQDLFGVGDYDYIKTEINNQLGLTDVDSWTITELNQITILNLSMFDSKDVPSDFSIFNALQYLTINQ
ncbi:MAG: hypothetical protein ACK5LC_15380, partial [Coprobacillaceae bacterium]